MIRLTLLAPVLTLVASSTAAIGFPPAPRVSFEEFVQHRGERDLIVWGRIFPAAAHAIFLAKPGYQLKGDSRIPWDEDCVEVLATAEQFQSLKAAAGKNVALRGKRILVTRYMEGVAVYYRVRGRTTHLSCQATKTDVPVLYLEDWELAH